MRPLRTSQQVRSSLIAQISLLQRDMVKKIIVYVFVSICPISLYGHDYVLSLAQSTMILGGQVNSPGTPYLNLSANLNQRMASAESAAVEGMGDHILRIAHTTEKPASLLLIVIYTLAAGGFCFVTFFLVVRDIYIRVLGKSNPRLRAIAAHGNNGYVAVTSNDVVMAEHDAFSPDNDNNEDLGAMHEGTDDMMDLHAHTNQSMLPFDDDEDDLPALGLDLGGSSSLQPSSHLGHVNDEYGNISGQCRSIALELNQIDHVVFPSYSAMVLVGIFAALVLEFWLWFLGWWDGQLDGWVLPLLFVRIGALPCALLFTSSLFCVTLSKPADAFAAVLSGGASFCLALCCVCLYSVYILQDVPVQWSLFSDSSSAP